MGLVDRWTWTCSASFGSIIEQCGPESDDHDYAPSTVYVSVTTPAGVTHEASRRVGAVSIRQQAEMLIRDVIREHYPSCAGIHFRGGYPCDYFVSFSLDPEDTRCTAHRKQH